MRGNLRIEKKYKQRLKSHYINFLEMKVEHNFRGRVAKIEVNSLFKIEANIIVLKNKKNE